MSEHDWFHEHMIVYGAGGLSAEECVRLERHAAECPACAQDLVRQRLYEAALDRVCAPVHFAADWDDRVVETWRQAQRPRLRWSAPARWAASIAAVIMLGLLGAGVMTIAGQGWIAFPGGDVIMAAKVDHDRTVEIAGYRRHLRGDVTHGANGKESGDDQFAPFGDIKRNLGVSGLTPSGALTSNSEYYPPALALDVRASEKTHTTVTGGVIGGKYRKQETDGLEKRLDDLKELREGFEVNDALSQADRYADKGKEAKSEGGETKATETAGGDKIGLGTGSMASPRLSVHAEPLQELGVIVNSDPEAATTAKRIAELAQVAKGDTAGAAGGFSTFYQRGGGFGGGGGFRPSGGAGRPDSPDGRADGWGRLPDQPMMPMMPLPTTVAPPSQTAQTKPGADQPKDKGGDGKRNEESGKEDSKAIALLKPATAYYELRVPKADQQRSVQIGDIPDMQPKGERPGEGFPDDKRQQPRGDDDKSSGKKDPKAGDPDPNQNQKPLAVAQAKQEKQEPPQVAQRKIIRTGELEFEVEAFDNAVAEITRLISAIPGAFVATVNSEKLPNGKVRGSVVVRVPPEHLDKFVLDMRRDLTKAGELKSQRIGSQDITKQYTDIESRLRAARAMEERLINIIKTGKGEIKDLLAAERELGTWRTKIEEMEGEIRYYNNQVGLSTLTITAYEKEIRSAAAMVISEHVNMKIETDDVEKGLQAALTAVAEAKGRVTKSDLTQQTAGQIEAVMQFEVAPAAAPGVKDKLKQLGVVTHHDAQRMQQAENGAAAPSGEPIKSRQSDVRFSVTLYNVANIKPRETFELQVAVPEVPAEYGKLLETVTKAKGQIRVSQLDEKDKFNIYAQLDFDVPSSQKGEIEKRLAELGDIVSKNTARAGPGETATDRKVGYRLVLKSITSIQARETFVLQVAVTDVPGEYGKVLDAVATAKGQVRVSQLNEQDRLNVHAQLDFDVPSGQRDPVEKQLAALGEVVSRNTTRAAPNDVATDRKVTYRLTLKSVLSVLPRETFTLYAISLDVPAGYKKLHEAVAQAKGHVRTGQLNEQDKHNVTAQLDFDVPAGEQAVIDKLLDEIGDVYSRTTNRAQPGEIATDKKVGYRLSMQTRVPPRETVALGVEVKDVDATAASLVDMVKTAGGKVTASQVVQDASGKATAFQLFDVPLSAKDELLRRFKQVGHVRAQKQTQNVSAPGTRLATAHIDVTLTNVPPIVPTDEGMWPQIRNSLAFSFRLLSVSLMFVIVGLCVVLPWALVLWVAVKVFRRVRTKPA